MANGSGLGSGDLRRVLAKQVRQVTLKHALTSYSEVAESEDYRWPLSTFLPGVLASFDLPDCDRELATKSLRQFEPRGAGQGPAT